MNIAMNKGSQGPFVKFSRGFQMFKACLERFYERK